MSAPAPVVVAAPITVTAPLPAGAPHLPRPSASLYVGNLAYDVQEANLYEIFNQVGPVASIRVCRDTFTRRSLGYAYVNFHTPVDAERALDTLNYAPIKGRPCRIMWSQRDPALRKSGQGNIFIKNLDKSIDNKTLHDTFSAFGNILSCRVMADENGNSLGFGYVHFENSESAKSAITKINGMLLNGKKVYVGPHLSKRERDSKFDQNQKTFTNVFVKNLDETVTEEEFVAVFSQFGSITSAVIMRDEQGKSKGFGFVNYTSHESAFKACEEKNEDTLNASHPDKNLFVGRAKKKSEMRKENLEKSEMFKQEKQSKYQGVNLYVKNLDDTVDDERLRKEFEVFGTITSAKVQLDEKNHSKGFGFVCYNSAEEATKAVTEMNGRMIENKPIYVALAQRKEQRRQQLEVLYNQRSQMRLAQTTGVLGPMYPQPVFYGQQMGIPPQNRVNQQFIYPPIPRPRWNGPQVPGAPQGQEMLGGYPPQGPGAQVGRPPRMGGNVNGPRRGPPTGIPPQRSGIPNGLAPGQPQLSAGPTRGGKGYRYTGNVRNNRPEQGQPLNQIPLSAASLADQDPMLQKQLLGTRLYELVLQKDSQNAPKITGMLLDLDTTELLHLIDSDEALTAKVEEALSVLHEEGAN